MASETSICNAALIELGATTIVDIDDDDANAVKCKARYATVRDALLRRHPWNFAMGRVKLARRAAAPEFGFAHAFQLPSDNLAVRDVCADAAGRHRPPYRIEGGETLLADVPEVWLRYTRRVTSANAMPPDFRETLAFFLAETLAVAIKNSKTLKEQMAKKAEEWRVSAMSTDGIEDWPEAFPESDWITGRF